MLNSTSNRKPSPVPTNSTNANNGSSMFSPSVNSLAVAYATAVPNDGDQMYKVKELRTARFQEAIGVVLCKSL